MKKYFFFLLSAIAILASSCEKTINKEPSAKDEPETTYDKLVKAMGEGFSPFFFTDFGVVQSGERNEALCGIGLYDGKLTIGKIDGTTYKLLEKWVDSEKWAVEWYMGYGDTAKASTVKQHGIVDFEDGRAVVCLEHKDETKIASKYQYIFLGKGIFKKSELLDECAHPLVWYPGTVLIYSEGINEETNCFDYDGKLLAKIKSKYTTFRKFDNFISYKEYCGFSSTTLSGKLVCNFFLYDIVKEGKIWNVEYVPEIPNDVRLDYSTSIKDGVVTFTVSYVTYAGDKGEIVKKYNVSTGADEDATEIDRSKLYGTWEIVNAKFAADAIMTPWEYEKTTATFKENGVYEGEGHFGDGSGTYSVSGNVINVLVNNLPFIDYNVTTQADSSATMIATFRSNGQKVWMDCKKVKILEENPIYVDPSEQVFENETNVKAVIAGLYSSFSKFIEYQLKQESYIINKQFQYLSPDASSVSNVWNNAFVTISRANTVIDGVEKAQSLTEPFKENCLAHTRAIRAFVYYNINMLWNGVPLIKTVVTGNDDVYFPRSSAGDVYSFVETELNEILGHLSALFTDTPNTMTNESVSVLLAECELTLSKNISAKTHADVTSRFGNGQILYIPYSTNTGDPNTDKFMDIYNVDKASLYKAEANGTVQSLAKDWGDAFAAGYGYWATLKRLGIAKDVTGCKDYQLLLPIPSQEMMANPKMTQNPGY